MNSKFVNDAAAQPGEGRLARAMFGMFETMAGQNMDAAAAEAAERRRGSLGAVDMRAQAPVSGLRRLFGAR